MPRVLAGEPASTCSLLCASVTHRAENCTSLAAPAHRAMHATTRLCWGASLLLVVLLLLHLLVQLLLLHLGDK